MRKRSLISAITRSSELWRMTRVFRLRHIFPFHALDQMNFWGGFCVTVATQPGFGDFQGDHSHPWIATSIHRPISPGGLLNQGIENPLVKVHDLMPYAFGDPGIVKIMENAGTHFAPIMNRHGITSRGTIQFYYNRSRDGVARLRLLRRACALASDARPSDYLRACHPGPTHTIPPGFDSRHRRRQTIFSEAI